MLLSNPASDAGVEAGIEALIAEAHERTRRRRRRVLLIAVGVVMVIAVGTTVIFAGLRNAEGPVGHGSGVGPLPRTAELTGFIAACDPLTGSPALPSQDGVVEVLRGRARAGPVLGIGREFVLPSTVVATERIGTGQRFHFHLAPGQYVLLARFRAGGHIVLAFEKGDRILRARYDQSGPAYQFVSVSIRSGSNPVQVVPSGCL